MNPLSRWAEGLRFKTLFYIIAALFVADVLLPDFIPFIDEILLGLLTASLGSIKKKQAERG